MSEMKAIQQLNDYVPQIRNELLESFDWDLIENYKVFLERENERGGFFSKQDSSVIFVRHILDCLVYVWRLKSEGYVSRETNMVDVGTGPGLPGFLFACLKEAPKQITLLDSQKRKLSILEEAFQKGELSRAHDKIVFMYERAEEVKKKFDVVTSRAVVPYPFIAEVVCNLLRKDAILCPYLGQLRFDDDVELKVLKYSGFKIKKQIELSELSFLGKRHIKILQKDSEAKPGYPRPWKEIVKETKQSNG